jgi:hypothetical protein
MATDPVTQIAVGEPSLPGLHASVSVSHSPMHWRLLGFPGPGFRISVGYIDPGNWTADISGGGSGIGAPDIEAGPEKLTHERQAGT